MINVKRLGGLEFREWLFRFTASALDRMLRELQAYHPDPYSTFDNRLVWLITGAIHRAFEPELGVRTKDEKETLELCVTGLANFLRQGFDEHEPKQNAPTTRSVQ